MPANETPKITWPIQIFGAVQNCQLPKGDAETLDNVTRSGKINRLFFFFHVT